MVLDFVRALASARDIPHYGFSESGVMKGNNLRGKVEREFSVFCKK